MRILLTTDTVGGVWTFTKELAVGLLERGHTAVLVSLGPAPSQSQWTWVSRTQERYGTAFWFEASEAPLEWMQRNEFAYSHVEGLLLRVIEEFEVDVVHASQFCFGALPVEVPKVVTAHSDVLSWAEACKPEGLDESEWLQTYRGLVSTGLTEANALVAPTRWMLDALAKNFPGCARSQIIPNGRTLPLIERNGPRKLLAVTVGRLWDEAKGLAVLSGAGACVPVLLVGETCFESDHAPELKAVEFLGRLEEDEVLELLRGSSLYLATSIYEPFGLAPLEAALCGCGVVARNIASLHEVWGDAAEYFTDSNELSRLLSQLLDSPTELESLQRRSMARGLELSAARMVDAYLAKYAELHAMANACAEVVAYGG